MMFIANMMAGVMFFGCDREWAMPRQSVAMQQVQATCLYAYRQYRAPSRDESEQKGRPKRQSARVIHVPVSGVHEHARARVPKRR